MSRKYAFPLMFSVNQPNWLFNQIESYPPVNIKAVVRYLLRTTNLSVLVENNGYYADYTIPMKDKKTGEVEQVEILLDYTNPHFGGLRYWLVCQHCHKRVINLYQYHGALACRHCLGLKYSSKLYANHPMLMAYVRRKKALELLDTRRMTYANKPTRAARRLNRYLQPGDIEGIVADVFSFRSS